MEGVVNRGERRHGWLDHMLRRMEGLDVTSRDRRASDASAFFHALGARLDKSHHRIE